MDIRRDVKTVKAKSHIAVLMAVCLMVTMLFGGAASADSVIVTTDRLNMRKEADADSKSVSVVEKDDALSFVSEIDGWYQVKNGSKTGFVAKEYVKLIKADVEADVEANTELLSSARTARTTCRVNMRELPMTGADIEKVVPKKAEVTVVGQCGVWYLVKYSGKTGYLMSEYLTLGDSAPETGDEEADDETGTAPEEPAGEKLYNEAVAGKATCRVNLRKSASSASSIVKVVDKGDSVTITGENGSWYKVVYCGKEGYISKGYIQPGAAEDNSSPSTAPAEPGETDEPSASDTLYSEAVSGSANCRVNMRKTASTSSSIVKVVDEGDSVSLVGECGDWYKVSCSGKQGYILKKYVSSGSESFDSVRSGVTNAQVNLRASASTSGKVLKVLKKGTAVTVTGVTNGWCCVSADGKQGYISEKYVTLKNSSDAPSENEPEEDVGDEDEIVDEGLQSYPAAKSAKVTSRVNMRASASTSSKVLKILDSGTEISLLGQLGGFYQVKYGSEIGYISMAYVKLITTGSNTEGESGESVDTLYSASKEGVTTVTVNMRREPEGDILHTLDSDTKVTLIGERGVWYKVTYGSSTGYIAKEYVSEKVTVPSEPEDDNANADVSGNGKTAYITASVNMRRGAGTNYSVIKVLSKGDEITYYSVTDGWYLVKAGSDTGYVSGKYITTDKPAGSAPSDPEGGSGSVVMADWWTSNIQKVFKVGVVATVTDVDSGISWQVKRSGGSNHADVQPLTASDTAKMKQAYGGKWSWDRHAIWVTINGTRYAASMNGMPHGSGSITTNNFDGHHCIHFLNSRTHDGNRLDANHQAAVKKAYNAGK